MIVRQHVLQGPYRVGSDEHDLLERYFDRIKVRRSKLAALVDLIAFNVSKACGHVCADQCSGSYWRRLRTDGLCSLPGSLIIKRASEFSVHHVEDDLVKLLWL